MDERTGSGSVEHESAPDGRPLGDRFVGALALAAELHAGQRRKETAIPYVSHLLAVCSLVLENGGDEDDAVAALLHDAVEDQGGLPTLDLIRDRFGDKVAAIVDACSDTAAVPKPPALERKRTYVADLDLDTTAKSVLLVSAADKLHNLRSILADHRLVGDRLWDRFNLDPPGQLWYFRALADVYRRRLGGPLAEELVRLTLDLAEIVEPTVELRWAQIGFFADCAFAALGDPGAISAPPLSEPSSCGWLQRVDADGIGMVLGFSETDGLPVEIGLAGPHAIAARVEFVNDIAELERENEGRWTTIGRIRCERLAAVDSKHPSDPAYRVDLPLPAGNYTTEVFEINGDAVGLRIRLV